MFVDEASITVIGGDGGQGCSSFRREKFVPRGGPDGGNGGDGGSVILVADPGQSTLLEFRHHTRVRADRGRNGEGSNRTGRSGQDRTVQVPVGTVVLDESGEVGLADLSAPGDRFVAARGGRGGRGNASYATSRRRAPTRHSPGEPGQERVLRLELKLLADVGLVGFPNAGKSTLLSRISAATPKIADYPFTTLEPQLGVVDGGDFRSFVVADIPGLIEGAHEGVGLGHRFLRHVERCKLLLHLVDPLDPERQPEQALAALDEELRQYRPELAARPQIVVATKADSSPAPERVEALRQAAAASGRDFLEISAVSGVGLESLIRELGQRLDALRATPAAIPSVGVLGGTFDPVHHGHLNTARTVRRRLGLSRMLLVPAARPPHKPAAALTGIDHRLAMLRLALDDYPELELSALEVDRPGVGYTLDTLRELRSGTTPIRPVFVLGVDALLAIDSWHEWPTLLAEFDLVAVDRPGRTLEQLGDRLLPDVRRRLAEVGDPREDPPGSGGRVFHLPLEPTAGASSDIRHRIAEGRPMDDLVPPAVARYIQAHGLYRESGPQEDDR